MKFLFLLLTTTYHTIATWIENRQYLPLGQMIDLGGYKVHLYVQGEGDITVVLDHSLGGIDGYFIVEKIDKNTRICIYDRPGYGWSEPSPKPRNSQEIVNELDLLLSQAGINPPYILVGDSFGSYNVRLYAHQFPEKVVGLVLTDGLHEQSMLTMSHLLQGLKLFFLSGFVMSVLGSIFGLIRLLGSIGIFELIKKELRQFSPQTLQVVKRSFYSYNHWITMGREIWNLESSGCQVAQADNLGDLPIVSIKASTFFKASPWSFYLPIKTVNKLREKMHNDLLKLSSNCTQMQAEQSSHFVWVDEPEMILSAIQEVLKKSSEL